MEFEECFSLLAMRPAHAHDHCEEEQVQDANVTESEGISDSKQSKEPEDLTLLSPRALVQTFHRLQETRVQIYTDFRLSVAANSHENY